MNYPFIEDLLPNKIYYHEELDELLLIESNEYIYLGREVALSTKDGLKTIQCIIGRRIDLVEIGEL